LNRSETESLLTDHIPNLCAIKMKIKHIISAIGLSLIGVIGFVIYFTVFLNPFDFGHCDGHGEPDRYEKIYFDNGQLEMEGQLKDCTWNGLIKTYYKTGDLKSEELKENGRNHGESTFYYPNGEIYKNEQYVDGQLIWFKIYTMNQSIYYEYNKESQWLSINDHERASQVSFKDSLDLSGHDKPLTLLVNDNLVLRGKKDFYVINPKLDVTMDLRDTLIKYIPTAYDKKVDVSGNIHDFLWHRRINGDSLTLKVFYNGNEHMSNYQTWERKYKITAHNNVYDS
jgi:hypothetical protein